MKHYLTATLFLVLSATLYYTPVYAQKKSKESKITYISVAPPVPKEEVKPKQPKNTFWVDGYWKWNSKTQSYKWVKGRWVKGKKGKKYQPGHWTQSEKGWYWTPPKWVK
ncbi:MAG: hypothetical protein NZ519_07475 [Bacteroidia bacterium]|nr:hypothetical protein [Bacteroidia bacterium]MDW8301993.1 hypothetical protein [Bacteroidia bacterium]